MRHSESLASFAAAFCKAQAQMTAAKKDAKNPAFNSAYADLHSIVSVIRPCLTANGLSYQQFAVNSPNDEVGVETLFMHESGEWTLSDPCFIPVSKANAHGYGSALTYSRRYSLASGCGLEQADDDGNKAADAPPAPTEDYIELALKVSLAKDDKELMAIWDALKSPDQDRMKPTFARKRAELKKMAAQAVPA